MRTPGILLSERAERSNYICNYARPKKRRVQSLAGRPAQPSPRRLQSDIRAGKLWRPRSQLYRSQFLQVNMRLKALAKKKEREKKKRKKKKALAKLYKMHSFAPFSNRIFFVKNRQIVFAIE